QYTTLHYTTLHCTTLHYTTLHNNTLHYTTLHYTTQHKYKYKYTLTRIFHSRVTVCRPPCRVQGLFCHILTCPSESGCRDEGVGLWEGGNTAPHRTAPHSNTPKLCDL